MAGGGFTREAVSLRLELLEPQRHILHILLTSYTVFGYSEQCCVEALFPHQLTESTRTNSVGLSLI